MVDFGREGMAVGAGCRGARSRVVGEADLGGFRDVGGGFRGEGLVRCG